MSEKLPIANGMEEFKSIANNNIDQNEKDSSLEVLLMPFNYNTNSTSRAKYVPPHQRLAINASNYHNNDLDSNMNRLSFTDNNNSHASYKFGSPKRDYNHLSFDHKSTKSESFSYNNTRTGNSYIARHNYGNEQFNSSSQDFKENSSLEYQNNTWNNHKVSLPYKNWRTENGEMREKLTYNNGVSVKGRYSQYKDSSLISNSYESVEYLPNRISGTSNTESRSMTSLNSHSRISNKTYHIGSPSMKSKNFNRKDSIVSNISRASSINQDDSSSSRGESKGNYSSLPTSLMEHSKFISDMLNQPTKSIQTLGGEQGITSQINILREQVDELKRKFSNVIDKEVIDSSITENTSNVGNNLNNHDNNSTQEENFRRGVPPLSPPLSNLGSPTKQKSVYPTTTNSPSSQSKQLLDFEVENIKIKNEKQNNQNSNTIATEEQNRMEFFNKTLTNLLSLSQELFDILDDSLDDGLSGDDVLSLRELCRVQLASIKMLIKVLSEIASDSKPKIENKNNNNLLDYSSSRKGKERAN
ncbi:hypothetical protein HK099_008723 [Clydaea vesicula]|uniref:Uncharacterized protein n=1 Tax=Clydaea vesicula TaxID=447962 RepID=A0AAD5TVU1_9FUNG|nr:hypothetical protein HK099_008723 [Clydaea vesicula]KAJ3380377.1 hypothetical protein HDU92_006034 [Lobulomyces angularis]